MNRLPRCLCDLVADFLHGDCKYWRTGHENVLRHVDYVADISYTRCMLRSRHDYFPREWGHTLRDFRDYLREINMPIYWDTSVEYDALRDAMDLVD